MGFLALETVGYKTTQATESFSYWNEYFREFIVQNSIKYKKTAQKRYLINVNTVSSVQNISHITQNC